MAIEVRIQPTKVLYLRDPQSSDLGCSLLSHGIELLDSLGLEAFTFKKLSVVVGCTEATVYRYFSSKQHLLLYLVSWYWDWVHHLLNRASDTATDPRERLRAAVQSLTQPMISNPAVPYIDEKLLHRVVLTEGTKAYHTKDIDSINAKEIFLPYKSLTQELAQLILAVDPIFPYPRSLASSLFEMAHNHLYFAEHLPRLTDIQHGEEARQDLDKMLWFFVERVVG